MLQAENKRLKAFIIDVYSGIEEFGSKILDQETFYIDTVADLKAKKQQEIMDNKVVEEGFSGGNQMFITDDNWKVVITIMTGIEMSVRALDIDQKQNTPSIEEFSLKNTFEIHHPSLEKYKYVQFMDLAPTVFDYIRKFSGISPEEYLETLGPESLSKAITGNMETFKGMGSSGKSGSFFFLSSDKKYLVKTIRMDEFQLMIDTLPKYFDYLTKQPGTLISKVFGLHKIRMKQTNGMAEELMIIVMQNIFATNLRFNITYDLKGSTYKRFTKPSEGNAAKKDLNFLEAKTQYSVHPTLFKELIEQLRKDADFLKECHIIDYSLLLGVHDKKEANNGFVSMKHLRIPLRSDNNIKSENLDPNSPNSLNQRSVKTQLETQSTLGKKETSYLTTSDGRYILYFGIIDTLTHFNYKKRGEYLAKRVFLSKGVSCVPPKQYADRFYDFMKDSVFKAAGGVSALEEPDLKSLGARPDINVKPRNLDFQEGTLGKGSEMVFSKNEDRAFDVEIPPRNK